MFRWRASAAAAAVAVVAVSACSAPEPPDTSPSAQPSASASSDARALLSEAARLFDEYWAAVLQMTEARSTDPAPLGAIASEEVARAAAESVDLSIAGGVVPSATPEVTLFEADGIPSPDGFTVRVCTDPASTSPVTLEGAPVPLPGDPEDVPWTLTLGPRPDSAGLWIVGLDAADREEQSCSP